jgi:hypothetical protein
VPVCATNRSLAAAAGQARGRRGPLVVTRDFGASVLVDTVAPWKKGMNVMRLLAEHATVDTGYGGQFVSGVNGLRSRSGRSPPRRRRLVLLGRRRYGRRGRRGLAPAAARPVVDYHRWAGRCSSP